MKLISPLKSVLKKGLYGDYDNKKEDNLIHINEINDLYIFQIAQYKKSSLDLNNLILDDLILPQSPNKVNCNSETRLLWSGPKTWLLVSKRKYSLNNLKNIFLKNDFAITDLSHSRTIIEIQGKNSKEVLKKGCPYNFNELKKNICINSVFHGITLTIDMIDDRPEKLRLFVLRSFGESFYHSITDASLEFGYKTQ